jgi:myo-inositol-1(or 4)-monophosphatase
MTSSTILTSSAIPTPREALAVAIEAAQRGGAIAREQRASRSVHVSQKAARNLVTTADLASEKAIIETIRSYYPTHKILAEESSDPALAASLNTGPTWVIDPIDGTTNYAHGHFQVGVSVAFVVDAVAQAGAVLAPFQGELFSATQGGGSFLNDEPIRATETTTLSDALIATGFPYDRVNVDAICRRLRDLLRTCRDIRRLGAASVDISWVACGRLDAFYEETLSPWDGAAACLIAREAGAKVGHYPYDHDSQKKTEHYKHDLFMDNIVVAAPRVFEEVMKTLSAST